MRISDWSSDVCSSDLDREGRGRELVAVVAHEGGTLVFGVEVVAEFGVVVHDRGSGEVGNHNLSGGDRKSVVYGKSVSVRVDPGGRCIIKKNKTTKKPLRH